MLLLVLLLLLLARQLLGAPLELLLEKESLLLLIEYCSKQGSKVAVREVRRRAHLLAVSLAARSLSIGYCLLAGLSELLTGWLSGFEVCSEPRLNCN